MNKNKRFLGLLEVLEIKDSKNDLIDKLGIYLLENYCINELTLNELYLTFKFLTNFYSDSKKNNFLNDNNLSFYEFSYEFDNFFYGNIFNDYIIFPLVNKGYLVTIDNLYLFSKVKISDKKYYEYRKELKNFSIY